MSRINHPFLPAHTVPIELRIPPTGHHQPVRYLRYRNRRLAMKAKAQPLSGGIVAA